ncbi:MAG TPA: cobalamin-dependent protein, partial [Armatimonadota bacterium]
MNVLLVYPEYPDTFWTFRYALKFIAKKATYPPLGLLTVAAMLPETWTLRLVDMNVTALSDEQLRWADLVCISAMSIQSASVRALLARCRAQGVRVLAGGPLFTAHPDAFADVDYLVLNEAELTLPRFLHDFAQGQAQHLYTTEQRADLRATPVPRWELIDARQYAAMNIQFTRGCPFDCEFCNITTLFGRVPRVKDTAQILTELDALYQAGWR